ncbi:MULTISPECIES: WhiB family transcriptional regulator [unclassified Streptomyces]|uniref:WhiB family transcriptional regulator n=1 Tax=unclassified Streptomyces TaxID=2593676 RepID=UPI0033A43C50
MSMPETSSCPSAPGWQSAAACAGLSPRVVFSKKARDAAPALRACAGCPVRRACEQAVAPAENWFDGVCGGRLWRSGRPVPVPAHLLAPVPVPAHLHAPAALPAHPLAPIPLPAHRLAPTPVRAHLLPPTAGLAHLPAQGGTRA